MFVIGSNFVILGCILGLLCPQVHGFYYGKSSYCAKALLEPELYHLPRQECCSDTYWCSEFIAPGETNYGIKNDDAHWSRRRCSCDVEFYECLTENQDVNSIRKIRDYFRFEKCFNIFYIDCRDEHCKNYYDFFQSMAMVPYRSEVPPLIEN